MKLKEIFPEAKPNPTLCSCFDNHCSDCPLCQPCSAMDLQDFIQERHITLDTDTKELVYKLLSWLDFPQDIIDSIEYNDNYAGVEFVCVNNE